MSIKNMDIIFQHLIAFDNFPLGFHRNSIRSNNLLCLSISSNYIA